MIKIQSKIVIDVPKDWVWDVMLMDAYYRIWTTPFRQGYHYHGTWEQGTEMYFVGPLPRGEGGLIGKIVENRRPDFLSIEYLGIVLGETEDRDSELVTGWKGARENYTLIEKDGKTEFIVDSDIDEKERPKTERAWGRSLELLKKLVEYAYANQNVENVQPGTSLPKE